MRGGGLELRTAVHSISVSGPLAGWYDPSSGALNHVALGDSGGHRPDNLIANARLRVNGHVLLSHLTFTDSVPYCYLALVLDNSTNGAAPVAWNTVFHPISGRAPIIQSSYYDSRYHVLDDVLLELPVPTVVHDTGTGITTSPDVYAPFSFDIDLAALNTHFVSSTASIADILDDSIHLLAVQGPGDPLDLAYYARHDFYA